MTNLKRYSPIFFAGPIGCDGVKENPIGKLVKFEDIKEDSHSASDNTPKATIALLKECRDAFNDPRKDYREMVDLIKRVDAAIANQ